MDALKLEDRARTYDQPRVVSPKGNSPHSVTLPPIYDQGTEVQVTELPDGRTILEPVDNEA